MEKMEKPKMKSSHRPSKSVAATRTSPLEGVAPQSRKRRQRLEFFELQRQIVMEHWTPEQYEIFRLMCNEVDDDDHENLINREEVTFEIMFAGNNAERDMKIPQYLGKINAFEIVPTFSKKMDSIPTEVMTELLRTFSQTSYLD